MMQLFTAILPALPSAVAVLGHMANAETRLAERVLPDELEAVVDWEVLEDVTSYKTMITFTLKTVRPTPLPASSAGWQLNAGCVDPSLCCRS